MPRYGGRYRRPYRRRRYGRRRGITYWQAGSKLASGAYRLARWAASHINAEFKVFDVTQSAQTIPNTASVYVLNNVPQGTDADERIGRQFRNKSFQWRFTVSINPTATTTKVRAIIMKDTQPELGAITLADVLEGGDIDGFKTFASRNRLIFLRDMTLELDHDYKPEITMKGYMRVRDHSLFDAAGNMLKGRYLLWFVADEPTNLPSLDFSTRLRFLDN